MSQDDDNTNSVTRRSALKIALGATALTSLVEAPASAGTKRYELRFFRQTHDGLKPLAAVVIPDALATEVVAGRVDQMEFSWHVKQGKQRRRLGSHRAPGRDELAKRNRPAK